MTTTSTDTKPRDRVWLVAHDFSSCADAAAQLALDDLLDSRTGGRIVLTHVFTVLTPQGMIDAPPLGEYYVSVEQATRSEAMRGLERVAERLRDAQKDRFNGPAPVTIEVAVRIGTPAEGLVEEAEERGAERIVVGTHGRKGVSHFLLGSVAERVARLAKVPVLVAHEQAARRVAKEGKA